MKPQPPALCLLLLLSCSAEPPVSAEPSPPDLILEGVRLSQWLHGTPNARATADAFAYRRTSTLAELERLAFEPLDPAGQASGLLKAERARGRTSEGRFELEGDVRWESGEELARTEACVVDLGSRLATGTLPVEFTGPGYRLEGAGFVSELSGERRLTLTGGVNARIDDAP